MEKKQFEYNELVQNDFNIHRDRVPLKKPKFTFNQFLAERVYESDGVKDKINPNELIYNFKTEYRSPKDLKSYQNPFKGWLCKPKISIKKPSKD